jgi:spermidine/putrescine transport system substrate-binding protein
VIEKFASRDFGAAFYWNGAAMRSREANPAVKFGYPKEGFPFFMDSAAILADAKNVENAKLFLNFIMAPENAAMISAFARYANGIKGSEAYMPAEMRDAPELVVPKEFEAAGEFLKPCSPEVNDIYAKIWTEVLK